MTVIDDRTMFAPLGAGNETETSMSKLIQICASQNDLFALDAEGVVYHYNFNTNHWMRLGDGRRREAKTGSSRPAPPPATEDQWDHDSRRSLDGADEGHEP